MNYEGKIMLKSQMKLLVALLLIAGTANVFAGGPGETIRNSASKPKNREQTLKKIQSNELFKTSTGEKVAKPATVLTRAAKPATVLTRAAKIAAENEAAKKAKRAKKVAAAAALATQNK